MDVVAVGDVTLAINVGLEIFLGSVEREIMWKGKATMRRRSMHSHQRGNILCRRRSVPEWMENVCDCMRNRWLL